MKRTLIKAVSRIVTAQEGSFCGCRFPLEDKYGKYHGYESHANWELWHQDHDNINFEYFLKCTGCGYELAKKYWKDSDGTFVDYTDGIEGIDALPKHGGVESDEDYEKRTGKKVTDIDDNWEGEKFNTWE